MHTGVFITGGTGYLGTALTRELTARGAPVHVLARAASASRVVPPARAVIGDALHGASFAAQIPPGATVVHLVGTPHPGPGKAAEFQRVDLASARALATAIGAARVAHLVYVSVAHPAPVMHAYVEARRQGEIILREIGMPLTIVRPWYVLGPGHWWPLALLPAYWLGERLPATRHGARRLGLVTRSEMTGALAQAVVSPPPQRVRVLDVPAIRAWGRAWRDQSVPASMTRAAPHEAPPT